MRPTFPGLDTANSGLDDAIFLRYQFLRSAICLNGVYMRSSQFRGRAFLSILKCPMSDLIGDVSRMSIPAEIRKSVILTISIIMATFFTVRLWSNKCRKNQAMNMSFNWCSIFRESYRRSLVGFACNTFDDAAMFVSDSAETRNFVKGLVPNNLPPYFHSINSGICNREWQA